VDVLEDGQALGHVRVRSQVGVLVGRSNKLRLELVQLGLIEGPMELAEAAMLMTEHAVFSEFARLLMIKSPTVL